MLRKLIKDESGVAMGLAVIMIVLIGVMGAGLLVFVRNDLEAVVEVNQGQKAFDIADSGLEVARQHIAGDKEPTHYDLENNTACDAKDKNGVDDDVTQPWSPGGSVVERSFAQGKFTVTIQWLTPNPTGALLTAEEEKCLAPKTGPLPEGTDYFRVVSTGTYGDAKRRVEAIYDTYDLDVPKAYYTPGDVTISGSPCIENVSVFSKGNVELSGGGKCKDDAGNTIGYFKGKDLAYKAWAATADGATSYPNTFNSTPRPVDDAGIGATGQITGSSKVGTRDFDGDTPSDNDGTDFVENPSASQMTFPFDPANQAGEIKPDADRLCDVAKEQDRPGEQHYYTDPTSGNATLNAWPDNSSKDTVVCYEFTNTGSNHTLTWFVNGDGSPLPSPYNNGKYAGCEAPIKKGTLIIRNGNFTIKPNTALFAGVVVVRGTTLATDVGASLTGNVCLDGFINSSGPIKISGTVTPAVTKTTVDRPGFYGVRQWSWRELYQ